MLAGCRLAWVLGIAVLALSACRSALGPPPDCPGDPDAAVMELRDAWQRAPYHGLYEKSTCSDCETGVRSKEMIRRQTENLLYRFPRHAPTRLMAGLLAYEAGDPVRATEHLDTALEIQPVQPEAVVLRARIAMEAGNAGLAKRILKDQIALVPNDALLHETMSSAYFLDDAFDDAMGELDIAERLGGLRGRIEYNRGVIEEARGNTAEATGHYKTSLTLLPHWPQPKIRLEALDTGLVTDTQTVAYPPVGTR